MVAKLLYYLMKYDLLSFFRKRGKKRYQMLLKISDAKEKMVVKLTNPLLQYIIGEANPAVGTKYEIAGIVEYITRSSIHVRWNNGKSNSYVDDNLSCIEDIPEGNINSIWD